MSVFSLSENPVYLIQRKTFAVKETDHLPAFLICGVLPVEMFFFEEPADQFLLCRHDVLLCTLLICLPDVLRRYSLSDQVVFDLPPAPGLTGIPDIGSCIPDIIDITIGDHICKRRVYDPFGIKSLL